MYHMNPPESNKYLRNYMWNIHVVLCCWEIIILPPNSGFYSFTVHVCNISITNIKKGYRPGWNIKLNLTMSNQDWKLLLFDFLNARASHVWIKINIDYFPYVLRFFRLSLFICLSNRHHDHCVLWSRKTQQKSF